MPLRVVGAALAGRPSWHRRRHRKWPPRAAPTRAAPTRRPSWALATLAWRTFDRVGVTGLRPSPLPTHTGHAKFSRIRRLAQVDFATKRCPRRPAARAADRHSASFIEQPFARSPRSRPRCPGHRPFTSLSRRTGRARLPQSSASETTWFGRERGRRRSPAAMPVSAANTSALRLQPLSRPSSATMASADFSACRVERRTASPPGTPCMDSKGRKPSRTLPARRDLSVTVGFRSSRSTLIARAWPRCRRSCSYGRPFAPPVPPAHRSPVRALGFELRLRRHSLRSASSQAMQVHAASSSEHGRRDRPLLASPSWINR